MRSYSGDVQNLAFRCLTDGTSAAVAWFSRHCLPVCCCAGAGFLLWELSTPFVHFRWFLHRSGASKSRLYVVNGLAMLLVFFLCRPLWGTWLSYRVRGFYN
jgi:hypothetical protein